MHPNETARGTRDERDGGTSTGAGFDHGAPPSARQKFRAERGVRALRSHPKRRLVRARRSSPRCKRSSRSRRAANTCRVGKEHFRSPETAAPRGSDVEQFHCLCLCDVIRATARALNRSLRVRQISSRPEPFSYLRTAAGLRREARSRRRTLLARERVERTALETNGRTCVESIRTRRLATIALRALRFARRHAFENRALRVQHPCGLPRAISCEKMSRIARVAQPRSNLERAFTWRGARAISCFT